MAIVLPRMQFITRQKKNVYEVMNGYRLLYEQNIACTKIVSFFFDVALLVHSA